MTMADVERNSDGTVKVGSKLNPTGSNGHTPITDAIRVLMSRDEKDPLDDVPMNNAQRIALEWVKKAKAGELPAAISLSDRVEGKPVQRNELTGKDGGPIDITSEDRELIRRKLVSPPTEGSSGTEDSGTK